MSSQKIISFVNFLSKSTNAWSRGVTGGSVLTKTTGLCMNGGDCVTIYSCPAVIRSRLFKPCRVCLVAEKKWYAGSSDQAMIIMSWLFCEQKFANFRLAHNEGKITRLCFLQIISAEFLQFFMYNLHWENLRWLRGWLTMLQKTHNFSKMSCVN